MSGFLFSKRPVEVAALSSPWRFDPEGQLSHKQTFKIPRLSSASGTNRPLNLRKKRQDVG